MVSDYMEKAKIRNDYLLKGNKQDVEDFYRYYKLCLLIDAFLGLVFLVFTILQVQEFTHRGFILALISFGLMFFYNLADLLLLKVMKKRPIYPYFSFIEFLSCFTYLAVLSCFLGLTINENKTPDLSIGMWVISGVILVTMLSDMFELVQHQETFKKVKKVLFVFLLAALAVCLVYLVLYFIKALQTKEQVYFFALNAYASLFLLLVMPCVAFSAFTGLYLGLAKKEDNVIETKDESKNDLSENKVSAPSGRRDENISDCEEDSSSHYA